MLNSLKNTLLQHENKIVVSAWLISTIAYYFLFRIHTDLEAEKYISEASNLLTNGKVSAPRFYFYFSTISVISLSFLLKTGYVGAIVMQCIVNLFAYLLFFKALKKLFSHSLFPILIIIYLLSFWPYQSWIMFLYTESLFYSSILILTSVIIMCGFNGKNFLLIILCLAFAIISRPLGILLVGSVIFSLFYYVNRFNKVRSTLILFGFSITAYWVINLILSTISDWYILKPFVEENIICNFPTKGINKNLVLTNHDSPLYELFYYISHNPTHFFSYILIKLKYFFLLYRSYYSTTHNAFLLLNIIPIYFFALIGIIKNTIIPTYVFVYLIVSILFFTIAIVLQCDDWHNRFVLSIFPIILILATTGIIEFKKTIRKT